MKKGKGHVRSYRIPWISKEMHPLRSTFQHIRDLEVYSLNSSDLYLDMYTKKGFHYYQSRFC